MDAYELFQSVQAAVADVQAKTATRDAASQALVEAQAALKTAQETLASHKDELNALLGGLLTGTPSNIQMSV